MSIPRLDVTSRELYSPIPVYRKGCPCTLTPTHSLSTKSPVGERRNIVQKRATMVLSHKTKTNATKNTLLLGPLHQELEVASLPLVSSGAANILLSKVSFDCLIIGKDGKESRDYISFDLKIPGVNTDEESVFSYDTLLADYGSQENLYAALKHFYRLGHKTVNPSIHKHGHNPEYDLISSKHDQYIRHTEQLLVGYLALPQGARMLCNRLRAELRGKYSEATTVKVYNMGLHMHSTKTCCAPCEYSLIGLMNEDQGYQQNGKTLGFLPNFKQACSLANEQLSFKLPQSSPFRLVVTVSASGKDSDHQKQPEYRVTNLGSTPTPSFAISVKSDQVSKEIFTAILCNSYDSRRVSLDSTLADKTVGISGSKATKGSPGTMSKVKAVRHSDLSSVRESLRLLCLEE